MRCEHCGNEFVGSAGAPCPRCGHSSSSDRLPPGETTPPDASDAPAAPAPPPPDEPEPPGIPWERERSFGSFWETWKGVLLQPGRTFSEASPDAGFGTSLGYWLILALLGICFSAFWTIAAQLAGLNSSEFLQDFLRTASPEMQDLMARLQPQVGSAAVLMTTFLIPFQLLAGLVSLFIWAGVVHVLLMMFGGARHGFEATFRGIAYSLGTVAPLTIVPICGGFIAFFWGLVLQMMALFYMHRSSELQAVAAILVPFLLCCLCVFGLTFLVASMMMKAAGGM